MSIKPFFKNYLFADCQVYADWIQEQETGKNADRDSVTKQSRDTET